MIYGLFAAGIAAVDLILKRYAEAKLSEQEDKPVCGGKVLLTKYHNHGAALNILEHRKEWVLAGSCALFGGLAAVFAREKRRMHRFALACLFGGAASNVSDRVRRGYVVDYIRFPFLKKIVWNIGDIFILLGSLLLVFGKTQERDRVQG